MAEAEVEHEPGDEGLPPEPSNGPPEPREPNLPRATLPGPAPDFHYFRVFGVFALVAALLVALIYVDLRPQPIYNDFGDLEALPSELPGFVDGVPLSIEFEAQKADFSGVYWLNFLPHADQKIRVRVLNLESGELIADEVTETGKQTRFKGDNAPGDRLRVVVDWIEPGPPRLRVTERAPSQALELRFGDSPQAEIPLLYFGHRTDGNSPEDPELAFFPPEEMKDEGDFLRFPPDEPVIIEFEARAPDLNFLRIPGLLPDEGTEVDITIHNRTQGKQLKRSRASGGESYYRRFEGDNAVGDRMAVELKWRRGMPPLVQVQRRAPAHPVEYRLGGEATDVRLAFMPRYAWPTFQLLWLWLPALAACAWSLWQRGRGMVLALLLLGAAAAVTGMLCWQQNYGHFRMHFDPDDYGGYAQALADYVRGAQPRAELAAWMHDYMHTHVALVPLLVAALVVVGTPMPAAYLWVAIMAGFGSVLLTHFSLRRHFRCEARIALLLTALFAMHFFVVRSFRISTDSMGLLLTLVSLVLLFERLERRSARLDWLLAGTLFLQALARPPGLALFVLLLGAALLCDVWRERRLALPRRISTGFLLGTAPALLLAGLYFGFGWTHNQALALEKSKEFHPFSTPHLFWTCLPGLVQLFYFGWIASWIADGRNRSRYVVAAVWGALYAVLLVVVKAPFLLRLFLPLVPTVILLSAGGAGWAWHRRPIWLAAFAGTLVAANLAVSLYVVSIPYLPPIIQNRWVERFELLRYIY